MRRRRNGFREVTVSVDVSLDEFDDDDLIEEIRDRGLVADILSKEGMPDASDTAKEIYADLAVRRYSLAQEKMAKLMAAFIPPAVIAAAEALREGRWMDATCELDDFIWPSKAATATSLPKPPATTGSVSP